MIVFSILMERGEGATATLQTTDPGMNAEVLWQGDRLPDLRQYVTQRRGMASAPITNPDYVSACDLRYALSANAGWFSTVKPYIISVTVEGFPPNWTLPAAPQGGMY
jgi:hypothetical protein